MDRDRTQSGSGHDPGRVAELTTGLRRLARGLVRSEADAEDLVQDAWVAALRSPPDDDRRLGGWLRKTLRNLAIDRGRKESRRVRHESAAAVPEATHAAGLEQLETLRALLEEVSVLEEPYCTAVRLRYLEGMPPRQIAKQLGAPTTTVHTWIQRGLARLRERLDARHGGRRAAWLTALLPLARPEAAVLGAGALAGLVLLMKTQIAALLAVCVLGGGGAATWWLLQEETVARVDAEADGSEGPPQVRVAALPAAESKLEPRTVVTTPEVRTDEAVATLARVRGRCVDDVTGAPLAGVVAEFEGTGRNDEAMARHSGVAPWVDPEPVLTDSEGRFEIAFVPHPATQHFLDLSFEGYAPRTGRWGSFEPGEVQDLGDVRMLAGYTIEGLVLGPDELPMERVSVSLADMPLPIRPNMAANDSRGGSSGADGRFVVRAPVPAGTWPVSIYRGGYLVGPKSVKVPLTEPLIVRVAELQTVKGRVVDGSGAPLKGIYVEGESASGRYLSASWTKSDGRFAIRQRQPDDGPPVEISVNDVHGGRRIARTRLEVDAVWGQDDFEIQVERTGKLAVRVVEDATGEPVEEFALRLYPESNGGGSIQDLREGGAHPGGRAELFGLEPGGNVLVVVPSDSALLSSVPQTVRYDGRPIESPVEVRLARSITLSVRVVDREGEPVEGADVELVDPGTGQDAPFSARTQVYERAQILKGGIRADAWRLPNRIARQRTGADGRSEMFHDPRHAGEVAFRVRKEGYQTTVSRAEVGADQEYELRLLPATTVTGRITSGVEGYERAIPELWLVTGQVSTFEDPQRVALEPDGSFTFTDVVPGRYDLELRFRRMFSWGGGGSGGTIDPGEPLRVGVEISAGQSLDLGDFGIDVRPAQVVGTVTLDGAAPEAARLWFAAAEGSGWTGTLGAFPVAADGSFSVSDLPPGRWQAFVAVGCSGSVLRSWTRATEEIEVRAGERAQVRLALRPRAVRIRVVDQDDEPLEGVVVSAWPKDGPLGSRPIERSTNAAGEILLDPAPDVALWLRADARQRVGTSESVQLEPAEGQGGVPADVTLRVRRKDG